MKGEKEQRGGALEAQRCRTAPPASAPLPGLLCLVVYSQRFFGVGWTVAGARSISDLNSSDSRLIERERKVRTPQGDELANGQAG